MNVYSYFQSFCSGCSSPDTRLMAFIQWLTLASALLNPLVYTGFNTQFRAAIKLTVRHFVMWPRRVFSQ